MDLTQREKDAVNQWFLDFQKRLEELEEAVSELRDATGGIAALEERVSAVEEAIDREQRRTGAEGAGKRRA